ncbi:ApeA N-terminal domain 1-containing protein [Galactobacter valiniphilus]|nr:HEPN domain-containing protein [Galactobacter valiniphilus]
MAEAAASRSRVGHLRLKDDYSELLPATLDEHARGGVLLRVPYLLGNSPERWFWSDLGQYIGENGKVLPPEQPPTELDYFDNKGTVGLVGCRSAGGGSFSIGGFAAASGVGELVANFAVEKAAHARNYAKINGFRSEIDGLGNWLDLWAHRTMMTFPKDGTPMSVTTTMEVPPDLRLAGRLNLRATVRGTAPSWQESEVRYTSRTLLQTYTTSERDWAEHLQVHRAMRDLLRIAIWKPVAFLGHEVTSDKEKTAIKSDTEPQSRWCEVKTAATGMGPAVWGKSERPLFVFADIKSAGVRKWLKFGEENRRGLRPFLRLLDIREGTIDEHMAQLGIALEAFGYQAFIDSGTSAVRADKKTLEQRVRKIVQQVASCLPATPVTFAKDLADGYNAVKHANRPEPDPADLVANYRLGVKVVRAWIALNLGAAEAVITERLS